LAHGFLTCAAPEAHIAYLREHPGFVHAYLDGVRPETAPEDLPAWWPAEPPAMHASWGVNHRNPDLYHWILNGGPALVGGAGAIFQAWYAPDHPATILKLDSHNERFALMLAQLPELAGLAAKVTVDSVLEAFTGWCKANGESWENLDVYACEPFVDEFRPLAEQLERAIRDGHGLIW
jgi:hypothetical protein